MEFCFLFFQISYLKFDSVFKNKNFKEERKADFDLKKIKILLI